MLKTCMWIIVPELWPEICFPAWRHRTGLTWGTEMEALREGRRSGSQKHLTPRNWVLEKQGQVPPILSSPSKGVTESLPRLSACVWGTRILRPRQVKWLPDFQPTTFSTTMFNITKYVLVYLVYPLVQSLFIFSVIILSEVGLLKACLKIEMCIFIHTIHDFKVYASVVFSIFTVLYSYHHFLIPEHFYHPKRKPCTY